MLKPKPTTKKRVYKKRRAVKKEIILPLYFGWQIRVVLSKIKKAVVLFWKAVILFCGSFALEKVKDLRKHIVGPFRKYWQPT